MRSLLIDDAYLPPAQRWSPLHRAMKYRQLKLWANVSYIYRKRCICNYGRELECIRIPWRGIRIILPKTNWISWVIYQQNATSDDYLPESSIYIATDPRLGGLMRNLGYPPRSFLRRRFSSGRLWDDRKLASASELIRVTSQLCGKERAMCSRNGKAKSELCYGAWF